MGCGGTATTNTSLNGGGNTSMTSSPAAQLKATVTGPKGELLYLKLYQQANGDYVGEYTPVSCGQHRVDVYYASQAIAGSPFLVPVFEPQLVEVIGGVPKELTCGHESSLEVDWSKCVVGGAVGLVDVELRVTAASNGGGASLNIVQENLSAAHRKFSFVPNDVGLYKLALLIAGHHVAGSLSSLIELNENSLSLI